MKEINHSKREKLKERYVMKETEQDLNQEKKTEKKKSL